MQERETSKAEEPSAHFKIYEFNYNENNAKSVISSNDRKKPNQHLEPVSQNPGTAQSK